MTQRRKDSGRSRPWIDRWLGSGVAALGLTGLAFAMAYIGVSPDKIWDLVTWTMHALVAWALYGKSKPNA